MPNEADTCRLYVVPKLQAAGWDTDPHRLNEQVTFTDGRIVVTGRTARRQPGKRADYILRYRPDLAMAVVEAKPEYATPGVPKYNGNSQLASVNLDIKNPNWAEDLEHQPPEKLVEDILVKEQRIIELKVVVSTS